MSEEISSQVLLKRISELERQLADANADAKKRRLQVRSAKQEAEKLAAERDALAKERESLQASPSEWQAKAEELQKQLRLRDHTDAWKSVIGETLNDKVELGDVWSKLKYEPGESVPTPDEIKQQAKVVRDAAPYLFRSESSTPAPSGATKPSRERLSVPLDVSRGDRDTGHSQYRVMASQMRNPAFAMSRQVAEASRNGTLEIVPD